MDLIETYVADALGIGLGMAISQRPLPANVRMLPLKNFSPATIGAVWRSKTTPLLSTFLDMAGQRARELK